MKKVSFLGASLLMVLAMGCESPLNNSAESSLPNMPAPPQPIEQQADGEQDSRVLGKTWVKVEHDCWQSGGWRKVFWYKDWWGNKHYKWEWRTKRVTNCHEHGLPHEVLQ